MKEGIYNKALNQIVNTAEKASSIVEDNFKGARPFDQTKITQGQMYDYYLNMPQEDLYYFIERHGLDVVRGWANEMEQYGYGKKFDKRTIEGKEYAKW